MNNIKIIAVVSMLALLAIPTRAEPGPIVRWLMLRSRWSFMLDTDLRLVDRRWVAIIHT